MARVEIPAPADLVIDPFGNALPGYAVTLKLAGTGTNATHWSALVGGTSTTGGLFTSATGTIVNGSGARRYVDSGVALDITINGLARQVEPIAASRVGNLPIDLGDYCTGDGTAEDATGFQAALNALPAEAGRLTSPPGKKYRISTALTCTGKDDVQIDLNGSYIESRIASGVVLTLDDCFRSRIISPRFRLMAGAPSAFIVIDGSSWWSTIYEPVIWAHINIPANCDGIVVQNDNYWVEVIRPQMRKFSGGITGNFRRGVSFVTLANAGKCLGGSINHCDSCVYINAANSVEVDGTAFETSTVGVELAGATGSNAGARITNIRIEAVTYGIDFTMAHSAVFIPEIYIGAVANSMGEAIETNFIRNPNNVPYTRVSAARIALDPSGASHFGQAKARPSTNQGTNFPLLKFEKARASSFTTALTADPGTGGTTLNVTDTTGFPASGIVRVDSEVIAYTGVTATTFTGCTRAQGGSVAAVHAIGALVDAGANQTTVIDTTGAIIHRSSAASPPAPADERGIIHHGVGGFITKIISFDPTNGGCRVQQVVGNGAGGFTIVTDAFPASYRPGTDATIDLGLAATRWRRLFLSEQLVESFQVIATDAAFTLQASSVSPQNTLHTGTLTANRAVTLGTGGASTGMKYKITRTGTGAFTLDVGTGPLKSLATNQWCEVVYNGSAWVLYQFGSL